MPKIVVLDGHTLNPGDNPWSELNALGNLQVYPRTAVDEIQERARLAEILLTNKTPLSAETLSELPQLRFISVLATGHNVVDSLAARARNIPVSNVPIYGTDTVAQFVFAMLLNWIHRPAEHDAAIREGEWERRGDFSFWLYPIWELSGKTLGIVGFGRIGRRVAELGRAFGMRVIAYNPTPRDPLPGNGFAWSDLESVFRESDVVSLHCPQTASNREFVNAGLLRRMKPSAILINTARGTLIREQDLADALREGHLAAALLDVVAAEPIRADNPLRHAPRCLITPHLAWAAVEARRRLMQITVANVRAFLDGRPQNVVN